MTTYYISNCWITILIVQYVKKRIKMKCWLSMIKRPWSFFLFKVTRTCLFVLWRKNLCTSQFCLCTLSPHSWHILKSCFIIFNFWRCPWVHSRLVGDDLDDIGSWWSIPSFMMSSCIFNHDQSIHILITLFFAFNGLLIMIH